MSRNIYLIILLVVGMIFPANGLSNWVEINQSGQTSADVKLIHSNIQETQIQYSLDGYNKTPLETPRGIENVISVGEGTQIMEKGMPDLAKLVSTIIIPDMDKMEINVVSSEYQEFTDVEVAPSKGHFDRSTDPDDVPFTYGEAYETDAFWPEDLAQLEEPFIMRDFRGQTVTIFPFQYNPVSKTLRVYTDIEVEITSTGEEGETTLERRQEEILVEPEFGRIYERFFLNIAAAERGYPMLETEEGSLLIICYDDFMDAMKPFVDWKRTTGRKTELVSTEEAGTTSGAIQAYVEDYYHDNENFAHLLLIGDSDQIPPVPGWGGHSDNAFGFIESPNFNDIFVGRFSAENIEEVETQVQRTIEYERDIDESDEWLSTGLGVARNEGTGWGHHGEGDHQHMDFIKDTLLNYTYNEVHSCYDGTGYSTSAAEISGHIEDGVSTINFCNHGSVTGWSVANYGMFHVNNLENVGKLPYIQSVACVNGAFVGQTCFAEAWLRATDDDGEPTGAIAMMAATINQPWQPPMCGQDEMVSIKTEESIEHGPTIKRTYGGITANGSMFMIPQYGGQGTSTHATWILFGDPSLMVRTDVPTPFEPEYASEIEAGAESFIVESVEDGATVAITMINEEDEVEILGTAIAEDDIAEIEFDEPLPEEGTVTLAITGFNKVTYINDEIDILETYTVTFNIEDKDGDQIENAIITFDGEEYEAGEYEIEGLEEGSYEYKVEKEGYFGKEGEVDVDDDITVDVTMERSFIVTFDIEDEWGNEIENATITFDGQQYEQGEYKIEKIKEGTYSYKVEKDHYHPFEDEVVVDDDITEYVIIEADGTFTDTPGEVKFSVFPNPARDNFTVKSSEKIKEIRLIDVSGQVILDIPADGFEVDINVSSLRAGVYFMQIHTSESVITERVQISQ